MSTEAAAAQDHTDSAAEKTTTTETGKATTETGTTGEAGKTGKDASADAGKADADKTSAATVPDKYTFTIPDAGKQFVDDDDLKVIETMARKASWSNDDAQAALTEHITAVQTAATKFLADTKADPTYGGEHLAESQRLAQAGIALIRPEGHARRESFRRFLDKAGVSNHIEVVSFLADLGKRASEDSTGQTSSSLRGTGKKASPEEVLYGKTTGS